MTYTLRRRWVAWLLVFGVMFAVAEKCGKPPFHDRWGMVPAAAAVAAESIADRPVARPLPVSHGNWNYRLNTDYIETRDTPKLMLRTYGRVSTTAQDQCTVVLRNDGYAQHGTRAQIKSRLTGAVLWDSGHVELAPGDFFIQYPEIASQGLIQEIYTKGWNDVGDVTFNDYTYDAGADDDVVYYPYGHWVDC